MRGALKFIDDDLPRAFADVDDLHLLGDLADAQTEASQAVGTYVAVPRDRGRAEGARVVPARPRQVRAEAAPRRRAVAAARSPARDRHARAEGDAGGIPIARRPDERRRSAGGVGAHEGRAPGAGRARRGRPPAARRARDLSRAPVDHHAAARRADHRRADARLLPLVVREHVDAGAVRDASRRAPTTTSPTSIRRGRPSARTSTCATTTTRRSGRSRFTRSTRGTSCTISTCAASNRRRASRSCSRRPRSSKAGRTTASR